MEKNKKTKKIFSLPFILGFVAFLCCLAVIAGLDKPHFMPFSAQVELHNPTSFAVSEEGAVLVDSENKRMLIYSDENTVSKIVETTASDSVVNEIAKVTMSGGYIYAIGSTQYNEGIYMSSEAIVKYDLNGNYVETLALRSYDEEEYVNYYTYKNIVCYDGNIYVTCADGKKAEVIRLGDDEETIGCWEVPEHIFTASYIPQENQLAVIGMSKNGYLIDCSNGDINSLALSEMVKTLLNNSGLHLSESELEELDEYSCIPAVAYNSEGLSIYFAFENITTGETKVLTNDGNTIPYFENSRYSFGLFLPNLLFYIGLALLAAGALTGLIWLFIKKLAKRGRIIIIVLGGIIFTSVFYTFQINTAIEDEFAHSLTTQTKQESFLITTLRGEQIAAWRKEGIAEFCSEPENQEILQSIHDNLKTMCDANGTEESCLILVYLFDESGQAYSFVDTENSIFPGQPIFFSEDVLAALEGKDLEDVLTTENSHETFLYSYGYIYDPDGNKAGVVCTAAILGNISYVKFMKALSLSITLIVLFIGIYVIFSTVKRFRTDIKHCNSREKSDAAGRTIDMAGIMTFAISMVSNLDSSIIVYVAESLCVDMDPSMQAILTALPLTAVTAGWLVGSFIADGLIRRLGERSAAIISSVITIAAMLFCMFSINRGSIGGYIIGKFVQNVFMNGVLFIEINTIPYKSNDKETRRASLNSIIQNNASAGIISTLMSGFVAEYLSYSMIYLLGGVLSAMVLVISVFVFRNTPGKKEKVLQKEKFSVSGKYWSVFLKKPMLMFIVFYVVPTMLVSGYRSYLFPMYTSAAGVSVLMLSSISILMKALTYVTNDSLKRFSEKHSPRVMLVLPRFLICAGLICFFISPNIYWAVVMVFAVDILLRMTSIASKMYMADVSGFYGLDAKRVQSNYYTVNSAVNMFQSPILSGIVGLGMNLACSVVGLIAGAMFTVFALFNSKQKLRK